MKPVSEFPLEERVPGRPAVRGGGEGPVAGRRGIRHHSTGISLPDFEAHPRSDAGVAATVMTLCRRAVEVVPKHRGSWELRYRSGSQVQGRRADHSELHVQPR